MKRINFKFVGFILILLVYVGQGHSQEDELKIGCDLKRFDPVVVSHALLNAVKKQVQPIYPPAARAVNASGEVEVQIVVSRSGNVIATCAISGHPLLRESAQDAAKQWRFKENFGYKHRQKRKYILSSITFRFDSDTSNEQQPKEAKSVLHLRFSDIADEDRRIADLTPVS